LQKVVVEDLLLEQLMMLVDLVVVDPEIHQVQQVQINHHNQETLELMDMEMLVVVDLDLSLVVKHKAVVVVVPAIRKWRFFF
jgi:glycerol-3-phosphate dehydrogenase